MSQGIDPACVICLTDMESDFPEEGPDVPVLWCKVSHGNYKSRTETPPFGQLLEVDG